MTTEHEASRTLVKSPPELWAECSDAGSLARHIGEFGEIRITKLEPETTVAWEAENASGTVRIEPSGWGTRVTLTAQTSAEEVRQEEVKTDIPLDEHGGAAVDEEPIAILQVITRAAPHPEVAQAEPVQEENDAKVEETVSESDPVAATNPDPAGGRWKRLIGRTRAWFRSSSDSEAPPTETDTAEREGEAGAEEAEPPETPFEPAESPEVLAAGSEPPEADRSGCEPRAVESQPLEPPAESEDGSSVDPVAILSAALDSLGQAHHRPFSRA